MRQISMRQAVSAIVTAHFSTNGTSSSYRSSCPSSDLASANLTKVKLLKGFRSKKEVVDFLANEFLLSHLASSTIPFQR